MIVSLLPLCSWAENQGYAVFDESTGTLTFKYGIGPEGDNMFHDIDNAQWCWNIDMSSLKKVVFDASFANARPKSTASWFSNATLLTEITGLHNLNTSQVTDMSWMFYYCTSMKNLDLSSFNTSNVTNMSWMFSYCTSLKSLNLSSFNTSNVTNMDWMFSWSTKLSRIFVGDGWSTANVKTSSEMFYGCENILGGKETEYNQYKEQDCAFAHIDSESSPGYLCDIKDKQALDAIGSGVSYAVFDSNTGVLTFMFGEMYSGDNVFRLTRDPNWDRPLLKKVVFDSSFASARPKSTASWFENATSLTEIVGLQYLNTSQVTDMSSMFWGCSNLTSLDLSSFNTENVTNMYGMFGGCSSLESLDLSSFNTGNVTNTYRMFGGCSSLKSLDLSSFNTGNVTNMDWMFDNCNNLVRIYVGNQWSTEKVTIGDGMFYGCKNLVGGKGMWYDESEYEEPYYADYSYAHIDSPSSPGFLSDINDKAALEALGAAKGYAVFDAATGTLTFKCGDMPTGDNVFDVSNTARVWYGEGNPVNWDIYKVKKVVFDPSFANARPRTTANWFFGYEIYKSNYPTLTEITGLQYLNTSSVTDMENMFYGLTNLKSLDVSHFDTRNVTNMSGMFGHCSSLTSLDVTGFNTSKVRNMGVMFDRCSGLTSLDLSHFDTSNVRGMNQMFSYCSSLKSLDLSSFNTSNVTDMRTMFNGCSSLTSIDLSNFDTRNVWEMEYMFAGCSGLKSLDVSHFDTSNVEVMTLMFYGCSGLTSLDLSNFNTSKVSDMNRMFNGCSSLTSIDLSSFDTSHLSIPHYEGEKDWDDAWGFISMFEGCTSLTSVDLSSFDTGTVEYMRDMFSGCKNLTTIYVSDKWSTENLKILQTAYPVDGHEGLFTGCEKLVGGKGTKFNANYPNDTYARIDGGAGAPGYFTAAYMEEGVSYIYENDGSMIVRDASESKVEVEIPSSLDISGEVHSVEAIQAEAFMDNEKLKTVTIPETIKEIGESAFAGCTNLTDIYCYAENPIDLTGSATTRTRGSVASQVFAGVDKDVCVLWVPEGCVSAYRNAGGWGEFKQIKELKRGDASGDGWVNVADMVVVVNLIKEGAYKRSADVNNDGVVDNQDLSAISDIIMEK